MRYKSCQVGRMVTCSFDLRPWSVHAGVAGRPMVDRPQLLRPVAAGSSPDGPSRLTTRAAVRYPTAHRVHCCRGLLRAWSSAVSSTPPRCRDSGIPLNRHHSCTWPWVLRKRLARQQLTPPRQHLSIPMPQQPASTASRTVRMSYSPSALLRCRSRPCDRGFASSASKSLVLSPKSDPG